VAAADEDPAPRPAGLLRRLAAMFYDGLLLAAVLMLVTALFLPLTGGEALDPRRNPVLEFFYRLVLAAAVVGYFGVPWTRRSQTLGMASWRVHVEREDGGPLRWGDVVKRLAAALLSWLPLGLGYAWILVDPERRAWHDRLTRTRVVLLPKARRGR
jgi:uncharacterized RDD family membrane protein YckC